MYRVENLDQTYEAIEKIIGASILLKDHKNMLSNALLESADDLLKEIERSEIKCDEDKIKELKERILKKSRLNVELFESDFGQIVRNANTTRSYTLEFTTTKNCNWNCEYCFEHGSDRTGILDVSKTDTIIEKIKEFLNSDWFKKNLDVLKLDFWGGEPFLNPVPVWTICKEFMYDERVSFHAYTNGSKIDPLLEIFEEASKQDCILGQKILIQFSYDGQPIHDLRRKDKKGNSTGELTLKQAKKTGKLGIPISFKSTVMIKDFDYLSEVWDDYEKLYHEFKDYGEINFSPTIDYTQDYSAIDLRQDVLEEQLVEIAAKESEFVKEHGRYLLTWFSKGSSLCTAGRNMTCVDSDGGLYYCHGAMYENDKEEFTFGNLYESGFANKLISNYYRFFNCNTSTPDECAECVATSCYRCNVQKHQNSSKDEFMEKWMDFTCMRNMCDYFKLIGHIKYALEDK